MPMVPLSVLDLLADRRGQRRRPQRSATRSTSRAMPNGWATALLAGRAPQHARHRQRRDGGGDRPRRRRHHARSASARAASCCPTTRRWSSPSSSARWRRCIPGRIDLGLGRAPGTDQRPRGRCAATSTAAPTASRRTCVELHGLFRAGRSPGQRVRAVPGAGLDVPIWILGSSLFGAQLAADARPALRLRLALRARRSWSRRSSIYRARFKPSEQLAKPYVMLGVNVFAADTDAEARALVHLAAAGLRQPADAAGPGRCRRRSTTSRPTRSPAEQAHARRGAVLLVRRLARRPCGAGSRHSSRRTGADELMVTAQIHDQPARLRSFEILAGRRASGAARRPTSHSSFTALPSPCWDRESRWRRGRSWPASRRSSGAS